MFSSQTRKAILVLPMLVGLGVAATAFGASQSSTSGPLSCEIQATPNGGMVALEAIVHAKAGSSGSYQFRVASSGSGGNSNVSQGGDFTADAKGAATVGQVMLSNQGATYDATLTVTADGTTTTCSQRVGGAG